MNVTIVTTARTTTSRRCHLLRELGMPFTAGRGGGLREIAKTEELKSVAAQPL